METLFQLPEQPLAALQSARKRYADAEAAYKKADRMSDESGEEIPYEVECEYFAAKEALYWAEDEEVQRLLRD